MTSFLTVVSLIQRDTTTVNAELVSAFGSDLLVLMSSNNPTALQAGVLALNKTAFGQRVKAVLTACKLPSQGFAGGALSGIKWRDQPADVTSPILEQHAAIVADFQTRLESAGLFDKKTQTDEQRATAKTKREDKKASELAAHVESLGLVDPATIPVLGINAQLDCVLTLLATGALDSEQVQALVSSAVAALANADLSKAYAKYARALTPVAPVTPFPATVDIPATV